MHVYHVGVWAGRIRAQGLAERFYEFVFGISCSAIEHRNRNTT